MRYPIIVIVFSINLWSCNSNDNEIKNVAKQGYTIEGQQKPQPYQDSLNNAIEKKRGINDTISTPDEPVKVLSARFVEKQYTNYKDIKVTYKNISGKDISSIRFKWYGTNAFGEPADIGNSSDGIGGGFTGVGLKKGQSNTSGWDISSKDLKKVQKAWVHEVRFKDGTKWSKE